MKKAAIGLCLTLAIVPVFSAAKIDDFSRAIAYYLIDDMELANKYLEAHFRSDPKPTVKKGFALLLKNEKWEATKVFSYYLESDHRSLEALTGVSLAVSDLKNSLAIENLLKITRMNASYAPAYLCLGNEYLKRRNYPAAEANFNKGVQFSKLAEYKLLLGELYLQTGQAQAAVELIQPESEQAPTNYYFALQSARAYYQLNDWAQLYPYLERALKAKPESKEAQLLQAQYFMKTGELKKAKKILEKLKFNYYNPEYGLSFAEVLIQLKDSDAEKYLYEVFSQNQWEPRINRLLGLYHLKKKDANVQNWIERTILSGKKQEELKAEFPAALEFPVYPFLTFFEGKKIQWLRDNRVLIAGVMESGEKEKLLVVDALSQKVIRTFEYEGTIQDIVASANLEKIIFSTSAVENEKVFIYTLIDTGKDFSLQPVFGYALKMPSIIVAFNAQASDAYITDGGMAEQAFVSPFTTLSANGRKIAVYPNFPFQVYRYNYANKSCTEVRGRELLRRVPIQQIQQYLAVADAAEENREVATLIEKGRNIDLTASEEVEIIFGAEPGPFIIYFSDLKNAFQGLIYDPAGNKTTKMDETMFLGEKYYSELDIVNFNPGKNEILFLTRDKEKNLYLFNYHTLLYKKLGSGILAVGCNPDASVIYFLSERSKFMYFSETNLEIVRLAPFAREKITSRRDLNSIVDCTDADEQFFTTFNGELLKLDEERNFKNCQVALAGAVYQPSPGRERVAAFINDCFYILPWQR
ncbi:MAG: tetratricopeptide repeat protein [Candidatus Aminicenantes bacterium]|nr:tetratricopeptide repeat protein [Candidatus Aminicenantes bacterium]